MFKTMLTVVGVVAVGFVAFQVGRSWDEIRDDAVEIADDIVNGPGGADGNNNGGNNPEPTVG